MPSALQQPFVQWLMATAVLAGLAYAFIRQELRVRAIFYGAFMAACVVVLWPPFDFHGQPGKIHLGLDLRGGIHLVLQVQTDDALIATVDDRIQDVREDLEERGIVYEKVARLTPRSYEVVGVEPARVKDAGDILRALSRVDQGGWNVQPPREGRFVVEMNEVLEHNLNERTVDEALRTLERRVNQLGVSEPVIARHGSRGDQILVQLPGVSDPEDAKQVIQKTAQLLLKLVKDSAKDRDTLLANYQGKLPRELDIVEGEGERPGERQYYLVEKTSIITGRDLKNARVGADRFNPSLFAVHFTLNPQGARRFREFTGKNIGKRLAIVLDGYIESAPVINDKISGEGQITGHFSAREADNLAKVLRAGALPATLSYLQELNVGASLGKDSIQSGIMASIMGMSFIAIFMLFYYRLSGLNAVVALIANLVILLGTMAYLGATLTLPGVAGVILTIGVGVDTNVLVFERIREELRHGKTVKAAIANGFERVWIIILDTHATALIAATFLFTFGTGPIRGFAVTLVIGLIANVFASYFVSKFIFEWILGKRPVESLSIGSINIVKNPNFDFLGKRHLFVGASLLLIFAGIGYIIWQGPKYSVEFSGGTQVIARFEKAPQIDRIRQAIEKISPGAVIQTYDAAAKNQVLIRIAQAEAMPASSDGQDEQRTPNKVVLDALAQSYRENRVLDSSSETVGPIVGAELRRKAVYLVCLGLLFQLIYIGIRFKGAIWGTAATVAVLHDVLVTLGVLAYLDHEISLNVIAALLTLVGYSVNDTIVIFDRARENLRHQRKAPLMKILQDALNQTLSRTLISNGTTFLAVLGLFFFGGEALKGFSFAMVVGIVVGTYSTIYIASPVVLLWESYSRRAAERKA